MTSTSPHTKLWFLLIILSLYALPAQAAIQCYQCHGSSDPIDYRPVDAPQRDIVNGGFPGNHRSHISSPASPSTCTPCHPGSNDYNSGHRDGKIKLSANINSSPLSATYRNATSPFPQTNSSNLGTCSNVNCHFEKTTPPWGSASFVSPSNCDKCHGAPPGDGTHTTHDNYYGPGTASCNKCHNDHTAENSPFAHATSVRKRNLEFRVNNSPGFTYSKSNNFSYPNYLPSQTRPADRNGTCSNISCHANTEATWGSSSACLDCHSVGQGNRAAIAPQFGANSHHIQGTITNAHCYQCHWEANSDGSINSAYHHSKTPGAPVELVIYGAGSRPSTYQLGETAVQYIANGTRDEIQKINNHCLGCHSDQNSTVQPFNDGKTPNQYAWDGTSVAARYTQSGTTIWGKYSTANGANKRAAKAYSAHGNAAVNKRGWNTESGVDGSISNTSGAINVQCFDCHNSHGSAATGVTTRYASATANGGIMKDTVAGRGGYSVSYRPYTSGSTANKNRHNPGANLCLDCHLNQTAGTTPWGYSSTFGATQPVLGYWDASLYSGYSSAGAEMRYPFKKQNPVMGGHFGASSPLSSTPMAGIDGLCTPCHDPHGVSPTLGSNQQYAVPLLKGTWVTSPYKEDTAPANNTTATNRADKGKEGVPYHIDQNTFGTGLINQVSGITENTESQTSGLCLGCHPKSSLTSEAAPGSPNSWKSKNRIHESVKGWKTSDATVKHNYSCSKCHTAHSNSTLPRLMVTNCLDNKHKGRTGYDTAVLSGSGSGEVVVDNQGYIWGIDCRGVGRENNWCGARGDWALAGSGSGRIPGSWSGYNPYNGTGYTGTETWKQGKLNDYSVACHEGQTGSGTDQSWNTVTPWYPSLAITSGPYVSMYNGQTSISWSTNLPGSTTIRYGATTAYGSTATGSAGTYHLVTFANGASIHYQLQTISTDGQQLNSIDYVYDIDTPRVTSFTVTTPSAGVNIPITSFTAADNVGITGYMVTTWSTQPIAGSTSWTATPPTSFTVPGLGNYTLYPWVKDAAGNVSSLFAMGVPVTIADMTPPTGLANASPANNTINLPTNTRIFASTAADSQSPSIQYFFQVSTDSNFPVGSTQESGWQTSSSYSPLLASGTTYYWRVKARDGAAAPNVTSYTPPWAFKTGNAALWTLKGDFENNLNTTATHPATTRSQVQVSGSSPSDDAAVQMILKNLVSGSDHTMAIKNNGTVWCWGANGSGQLGNNSTTGSSVPVQATGLTGIVSVAAGNAFSLALKSDGTVWAWGYNYYGQLGDGTTTQRIVPAQVKASDGSYLTGIVAVSAGYDHSLALKSDGTVWAWGYNYYGQLGNGSTTDSMTAVQVSGLSGAIVLSAGQRFSLAVKSDGTVWSWGYNSYYQLGDSTGTQRNTPVQVKMLGGSNVMTGAISVSAGSTHALALRSDGSVWGWGANGSGQLGDGTNTWKNAAVQVKNSDGSGFLRDISIISAGSDHSLALKSDRTVWAWGSNSYGQLGDGTSTQRTLPTQTKGLIGVDAIAAGYSYSLAVKSVDGSIWSWGSNISDVLGISGSNYSITPSQVAGLTGTSTLAAGGSYSMAIKSADGSVWTWGENYYNQLGDGTNGQKTSPVQVRQQDGNLLSDAIAISASHAAYSHSMAAKSDGTLWTWGNNNVGQLGDGTTNNSSTAIQVPGLTGIVAVAASYSHSLAVRSSDGSVWAWGENDNGQLGDGTTIQRKSPVQVQKQGGGYLTGITAVAAGIRYSLALKSDGTVWTWGSNSLGQLGDGTTTNRTTAVQITSLSGITALAAGSSHSLALRGSDGSLWSWGYNYYGQLGDGTTTQRNTPVQVLKQGGGTLVGIISMSTGYEHSLAAKSDGSVWGWGTNGAYQLGDGTTTNRSVAVQATGLSGIAFVAGGMNHSMARKTDGTIWGWGYNGNGQLGTGYGSYVTVPTQSAMTGAAATPVGTISGLKFDAGISANWGIISWNGPIPGNIPNIKFRTRGAGNDTPADWASAQWSDYYTTPGSSITTPASRWLEIELTMQSSGILSDLAVTTGQSNDTATPSSALLAPTNGTTINLASSNTYTINGTASDSDGIVQRIEVSTDNGATWNEATCTTCLTPNITWSYIWSIPAEGSYNIRTRATDSAGHTESPGTGVSVTASYQTDNVPPASAISTPLNGAVINPAAMNPYSIRGTATDYVAVQGVEVSTDGGSSWHAAVCANCPARNVNWSYDWTLPADGSYTLRSRATDTAGNREAPGPGIAVTTVSVPASPVIGAATAISPTSIQWNFSDVANNENGFKLHDFYQSLKMSSATPNINQITETDLTANSQYTRHLHAYNAAGDSLPSADASRWTLPLSPNVTSDKTLSTSVAYNTATVTFTNAANFGSGGVKGYYYKWDKNPTAGAFTGSTWESGNRTQTATSAGSWYLHLISYNGEYATNGQVDLGPFNYDATPPNVTGFTAGPVNDLGIPVSITANDNIGITGYMITTYSSQPYGGTSSGWSATAPTTFNAGLGAFTLYPWAKDAAGNVSALFGSPISVLIPPTGVVNASPPNDSQNLPTNTIINCSTATNAIYGSVQYFFQVSTDNSFNPATTQESGWQEGWPSGTSFTPNLLPNTTYYWRVKARQSSLTTNESQFTAPWSFTTLNTAAWTYKGDFENNARTVGSATTKSVNLQVTGINPGDDAAITTHFKRISSEGGHTLALKPDGTVWVWGVNSSGQLGNGTTSNSLTPIKLTSLSNITAVAAGQYHSLALKSDGSVWVWGSNSYGQLGVPISSSTTPVQVTGLGSGVVAIAAGWNHSLALKGDGSIWAWGNNSSLQLGYGASTSSSVPVPILVKTSSGSALSRIVSIAAKVNGSMAIDANGYVWGWGSVGPNSSPAPNTISLPASAVAIAPGFLHSLALLSDGSLWAWGSNYNGELGVSGTTFSYSPVKVSGTDLSSGIVGIAAGASFSLAVKSDGTVWAWGDNSSGQLGINSTTSSSTPVQMQGLTGKFGSVVDTSSSSSFIVTSDGYTYGTGANESGQLGNGSTATTVMLPVQGSISGLTYSPLTISKFRIDAGSPVTWSSIYWNGSALNSSAVKFRTRGADTDTALTGSWSNDYTSSPSAIKTAENTPLTSRWLEVELTLQSSGDSVYPRIDDFAVTWAGSAATIDKTIPTVTTTTPGNGAVGITPDSPVTIVWSENIDCATVDTSTVTISPAVTWTKTSCSGSQAVFTPSGQVSSSTNTYTVTVSTAVKDIAGTPMAANKSISYTTIPYGSVGYWKLDEGMGTAVNSSIGTNNGTLINGATWSAGKSGIALQTYGGAYVNIGSTGFPAGNSDRTIEAWIKTTSTGYKDIFSYGSAVSGQGMTLGINSGAAYVSAWTTPQYSTASYALNDGNWHHLVFVLASGTGQVYVDGVLKDSRSFTPNTTLNLATIASRLDGGVEGWVGYLDEIIIYNRALACSEILGQYRRFGNTGGSCP